MGRCPGELSWVNQLKGAGVQITLADYRTLAALNVEDLILFNEAEAQRAEDAAELGRKPVEDH